MPLTRRAFTARLAASAAALTVPRGLVFAAATQGDLGISHTADLIHREVLFKAAPGRVYAALTDAKRFDGVVRRSAAMKSGQIKDTPCVISKVPGGSFSLFGGYITGRQIELAPNTRIVQVWRSASWKDGEYSLVTWRLTASGDGTKLSLDHAGFPAAEAQHLAEGWQGNYLTPLAEVLVK
jgi:activator of HSP90 ATPase